MNLNDCPRCQVMKNCPKFGSFDRSSDGAHVIRYHCKRCRRSFSEATHSACYWQRKRQYNEQILKSYCSLMTQRRMARDLELSRSTIARKFLFLTGRAEVADRDFNRQRAPAVAIEFDDLETSENTKCKPVSITLAVEYRSRRILGLELASMPAKGLLAKKALLKYGPREDGRGKARADLFTQLQSLVDPKALIKSDQNPHYPEDVKKFFPTAQHLTYKGRRARAAGQGELKVGGFDPIFSLNHTCAMFRANMSRLIRKTWNTTKKMSCLRAHAKLYAFYHNVHLELSGGPEPSQIFHLVALDPTSVILRHPQFSRPVSKIPRMIRFQFGSNS